MDERLHTTITLWMVLVSLALTAGAAEKPLPSTELRADAFFGWPYILRYSADGRFLTAACGADEGYGVVAWQTTRTKGFSIRRHDFPSLFRSGLTFVPSDPKRGPANLLVTTRPAMTRMEKELLETWPPNLKPYELLERGLELENADKELRRFGTVIEFWNPEDQKLTRELPIIPLRLYHLKGSPDGKYLAASGRDVDSKSATTILDLRTGKSIGLIRGGLIDDICFSKRYDRLAIADRGRVRVFSLPALERLKAFNGSYKSIRLRLGYSPSRDTFFFLEQFRRDMQYQLVPKLGGEPIRLDTANLLPYVHIWTDGDRVAIFSTQGQVSFFDPTNGAVLNTIETGAKGMMSMALTPDGKQLAVGVSCSTAPKARVLLFEVTSDFAQP